MKLYFLEFILTTKCNQQCEYCNVFDLNKDDTKLEIDIDFLKHILKHIPDNTKIEFCGGEPGILTNLNEAFNITYSNPKVKQIAVMSNGAVRLKDYDWLTYKNVSYFEHLIYDLNGTNIEKFYDLDFIENPNWKYVIVTTQNAIKSLLTNFDYYKNEGFFDDKFWYKIMNPKISGVESFIDDVELFYKKLKKISSQPYIDFTLERLNEIKNPSERGLALKKLCCLNSPLPTINFETKELVHCGAFLEHSKRYKFSEDNFNQHLKCNLFKDFYQYCKDCYIYTNGKPKSIISCKNNKPYNYEIED